MRRILMSLATLALCQLMLAAAANASVQFSSTNFTVSQTAGVATITVSRSSGIGDEDYVRYGVHRLDGIDHLDYLAVGGMLHFMPGQTEASVTVPIVRHYFSGPAVHADVFLYGSWPQALGEPNNATLTILHDAPLDVRNPLNPLDLSPAPANGNVLQGAHFQAYPTTGPAGMAAHTFRHSDPWWARELQVIAEQPYTQRFGRWTKRPQVQVFEWMEDSYLADPGAVPLLSSYYLTHGACNMGHQMVTPSDVTTYERWINGVAAGIGTFRAVFFLEMDSMMSMDCLTWQSQLRRSAELRYAITRLERDPHVVVYMDAAAGDALVPSKVARRLNRAGVHLAQGFFVNATHYDWTSTELLYGQTIARALGGTAHFVVNTGTNGRGPWNAGPDPLCNPPGRGLGARATTSTGYQWADAFVWMLSPGERTGACRGAPSTAFWPAYAVGLVRRANYNVTGPRQRFLVRRQS
jgi:endoglucanase